jgi:predicted AlkP superfamily phosphohydrolase/phosphomutase
MKLTSKNSSKLVADHKRVGGSSFRFNSIFIFLFVLISVSYGFIAPFFMEDRARLIVVGIDGASWNLMQAMISRGELPCVAKIMRDGSSSRLESVQPCLSPAVWTSMSTGFLPESHGVRNFYGTLDKVKKKGFWEILSETDTKVGVYRWLITWPPVEINGFLVPNWLARDASCYPRELGHLKRKKSHGMLRRLRDLLMDISYGLTTEGLVESVKLKTGIAVSDFSEMERNIESKKLDALRRRDYFVGLKRLFGIEYGSCVFDCIDNFSHSMWQYMDPESFQNVPEEMIGEFGDVIEDQYRSLDRYISEIIETMGVRTYIMIVSDHGFKNADSIKFHPPKPRDTILDHLGLPDGLIEVSGFKSDRIFLGVKPGEGSEAVVRDLEEKLLSIVLEGEDEPVFVVNKVEKKMKRYKAVFVVMARDGLTFLKDRVMILPTGKSRFQDIFTIVPGVSGDHDPLDGIFFLSGPGVKKGYEPKGLSVLDIHPLILYLYGRNVAQDTDGTLRLDLFEEGILPAPKYIETYGERVVGKGKEMPMSEEALERMKTLGYIE